MDMKMNVGNNKTQDNDLNVTVKKEAESNVVNVKGSVDGKDLGADGVNGTMDESGKRNKISFTDGDGKKHTIEIDKPKAGGAGVS